MAKSVEQIATDLGLSITTIRLVLNGKADQYRISARTQERINRYVAEHGYTLNYTARSLKLNKTDTLGLVIPRLSNSFFSNLAEKLELRCREEGYHLVISSSYSDSQREKSWWNPWCSAISTGYLSSHHPVARKSITSNAPKSLSWYLTGILVWIIARWS
ncbi:HTH-type transcriptional repressor PurR [Sodalis praecaptivus]